MESLKKRKRRLGLPHLFYLALVDKEGVSEDDILDDYGLTDIEALAEKFNKLVLS